MSYLRQVVAACKGKSTEELIAAGLPKLASMGTSNIQILVL